MPRKRDTRPLRVVIVPEEGAPMTEAEWTDEQREVAYDIVGRVLCRLMEQAQANQQSSQKEAA